MNRLTIATLGASLAFAAACSSGSDEHTPAISEGGAWGAGVGGAGVGGAREPAAGDAGASGRADGGASNSGGADAGQGGLTNEAGASGDGGAAALEPGMVVVVPSGSCAENAKWKSATPLAEISSDGEERLLSITADELDVLFQRDGLVLLAHRAKASADFGTPSEVTIPADYDVTAGAALSADGKT